MPGRAQGRTRGQKAAAEQSENESRTSKCLSGMNRWDMLYGHKRSNLNLASEKEQMVWVEKMRKCDSLTNVTGSIRMM